MRRRNNSLILVFFGPNKEAIEKLIYHFDHHHCFFPLSIRKPVAAMLKGLLPFAEVPRLKLHSFRHSPQETLAGKTPAKVLGLLENWIEQTLGRNYLFQETAKNFERHPAFNWSVNDARTCRDFKFLKDHGATFIFCPSNHGSAPTQLDAVDFVIDPTDLADAARDLENALFKP